MIRTSPKKCSSSNVPRTGIQKIKVGSIYRLQVTCRNISATNADWLKVSRLLRASLEGVHTQKRICREAASLFFRSCAVTWYIWFGSWFSVEWRQQDFCIFIYLFYTFSVWTQTDTFSTSTFSTAHVFLSSSSSSSSSVSYKSHRGVMKSINSNGITLLWTLSWRVLHS